MLILVEHHLSSKELLKWIKSLEKDKIMLQHLYFFNHLYTGLILNIQNFAHTFFQSTKDMQYLTIL